MMMILNKFFALILIVNTSNLISQSGYEVKMHDAEQKFAKAKTLEDYNVVSNLYYEIANSQKNNWLPFYYAGLCKTLAAIKLKTKSADALCNESDVFIHISDSLSKNNVEIYVLKSLNFSARLNVNPTARALKYNKQINQANALALKLDQENPRVYLQKAQSVYYTPESFGGSPKKALPLYETALEKYKLFKPQNNLMPNWGKDIAVKMIEECKLKL